MPRLIRFSKLYPQRADLEGSAQADARAAEAQWQADHLRSASPWPYRPQAAEAANELCNEPSRRIFDAWKRAYRQRAAVIVAGIVVGQGALTLLLVYSRPILNRLASLIGGAL
jgi:hypothetical protein